MDVDGLRLAIMQQRVLKQSEHGRGQFGECVDDQRAVWQQGGDAF